MFKKMLCCLLAFALVLVSGGVRIILPVSAEPAIGEDMGSISMQNDFADDAVMVVMTHEASLQFIDYTPADFPGVEIAEIEDLSSGKGAKVQAVLNGEQLEMNSIGARFMNQNIDVDGFRRILCLKLANPGKGNVLRAVMALEQREDVYSAEPNYICQGIEPIETQAVVSSADQIYGWAADKIEQQAAWGIETGSTSVLVGVVDTGIDVSHPEWSNKVNTSLSRNYVDDGGPATQDIHGHGTHVAGIIGAKYNNDELNFSGVCQNVTLVSLRVANKQGKFWVDDLISAIDHSDENDIPILNISLTSRYNDYTDLKQAAANYSGLMICAAGNRAENIDFNETAPASLNNANIISVGASTSADAIWLSSNYGSVAVDLFAPGEDILSCYPRSLCSPTICASGNHLEYGYHIKSGTSMATPFVTGVAALILAHNPHISRSTIKSLLIGTGDPVAAFSGICVSGRRLNAYNALSHLSAHGNVAFTYVNDDQHRCRCVDCGITWLENNVIHPILGTCMLCN